MLVKSIETCLFCLKEISRVVLVFESEAELNKQHRQDKGGGKISIRMFFKNSAATLLHFVGFDNRRRQI